MEWTGLPYNPQTLGLGPPRSTNSTTDGQLRPQRVNQSTKVPDLEPSLFPVLPLEVMCEINGPADSGNHNKEN